MTTAAGKQFYCWSISIVMLLLSIAWANVPPLFEETPYSLVVEDRDGQLLVARIAADEQWRFPLQDSLPERFVQALVTFEDKRFFSHNGVDPIAFFRAFWQNIRAGSIESGGSTISMQVIRLSRGQQPRTLGEKLIEMFGAWHLEATHSKQDILQLYAAHAPFGGNVVGLEAAAWRYCKKPPAQLTWAEAACLAVLPNAPALLHPGRNQGPLLAKRNRLLQRLYEAGYFTDLDAQLSALEPLPGAPQPLPQLSYHLLNSLAQQAPLQSRFVTTIDRGLQEQVMAIADRHQRRLAAQEIHNLSIIVAEVETGEVRGYVGNVWQPDMAHESAVDVAKAPRSSGSILKPFLFAHALEDGLSTPQQLLPDIPIYYGSFTPENYDRKYDGAVPVSVALARSLNVPAVLLLQQYGVARLKAKLASMGMTTLFRPAEDYGLSLILGGAEVSLWDVTGMYRGMAHTLQVFNAQNGYPSAPYNGLTVLPRTDTSTNTTYKTSLSAGSIYQVFKMMTQVKRPADEQAWQHFASGNILSWKTGTSYGHRDGWAIGITPTYVVGIWTGNADGEGRPGLTGTTAAAPVLFDVVSALPRTPWFAPPIDDQTEMVICKASGHRVGRFCPDPDTVWLPMAVRQAPDCPYHRIVYLTDAGEQVHADCYPIYAAVKDTVFVLPPHVSALYKQRHPSYAGQPVWATACQGNAVDNLQLIYPQTGASLYLPRNISGALQPAILEAVHARPSAIIYWHLDDYFIGQTKQYHQLPVQPTAGEHRLTLVDDRGQRLESRFTVLRQE